MESGYAALGAGMGVIQLLLAVWAAGVAVRALVGFHAGRHFLPQEFESSPEARWASRGSGQAAMAVAPQGRVEHLVYLAALLSYALLGLSLLSWMLLYLILDSFVPQWPGAMCIYGVTRIGAGASGAQAWLPSLVMAAQLTKPLLVFTGGAAVVLYRIYRRSGTRALLPRVAAALLAVSLVAAADAAVELTYLGIPKREAPVTTGCCSASAVEIEKYVPPSAADDRRLTEAYYACHGLMIVLLALAIRRDARGASSLLPLPLIIVAGLALAVSARYLVDVAAPALLHLPYHHCLYDLVGQVPETGVAIALLLWGTFCVGWRAVAGWFGRSTDGAAPVEARRLPAWALLGYAGSVAMLSLEMWLA
jgi:hypothetical protein